MTSSKRQLQINVQQASFNTKLNATIKLRMEARSLKEPEAVDELLYSANTHLMLYCWEVCVELQSCKGGRVRGKTSNDKDLLLLGGVDESLASLVPAAALSAASAASACCIKKSSHWSAKESSAGVLEALELGLLRESAPATLLKTPLRGRVKPTRALSSSATA